MKMLLRSFLILTLAACAAPEVTPRSDASYAEGLLGTWEALESPRSQKVESESTYTKDGFVGGFLTATAKYPGGTTGTFRVKVRARWRVENGILHVRDYETEPAGVLPPGYGQKYQILALDADHILFRALDDGKELPRRRKLAGPDSSR